jgi:uncharacterized membrane protein YfcA
MNIADCNAKDILLITLAGFTLFYATILATGIRTARREERDDIKPTAWLTVTGFVTNFFDTLGIGSFATTTAIFRHWRMVRDEIIPGTLNAGHTLPTIAQAVIFTQLVPVDSTTLILMIVAAVVGAWLGAGLVARWPRKKIQIGMGSALFAAACLMLLAQLELVPAGGEALALSGGPLWIGVIGNFILGAMPWASACEPCSLVTCSA